MKIKLSLFFLVFAYTTNAFHFSKQKIHFISKRFFENLKNKTSFPSVIVYSNTTTAWNKNDSNITKTIDYDIFL